MTNQAVPVPHPLVADLHCDTLLELHGGASLAANPAGHLDLPRLRQGRVGLQVFACFVPGGLSPARAKVEADALLDTLTAACTRHADAICLVDAADGVAAAVAAGRIAGMAAIENGLALANDPANLEHFRARGVRYLTLTHARHLDWAASCSEEWTHDHGLSPAGVEIVREMNRLGMIVDVSHVHERTFWDVARVARRPFIASHSNAFALCPVSRNLTDDQLRAVAASGGMVGINFFPGFLDPDYLPSLGQSLDGMFRSLEEAELRYIDEPAKRLSAVRALSADALQRMGPARASIDTVCDHIEHIMTVAGEDHVGFGSDFDGVQQLPHDIPDATAFPTILDRLAARGASQAALRKLAWENWLRVLRANES